MSPVKTATHTPGPWTVANVGQMVFAGNMLVLQIRGWGHLTGRGGLNLPEADAVAIQTANANLVAAAPDLLDALRAFCGDYEATPTTDDNSLEAAYRHALQVIAKAEGQ